MMNGNKPELLYDFFRPNLWEKRLDSIDDAADTTFKLFEDIIVNVEGFSAEKFAHLLREAGGEDYTTAIQRLVSDPSEATIKQTADQIRADFGKKLGHLSERLAYYLETKRLPLTAPRTRRWSNFEVRQLFNLYTFCYTIYNSFWNSLRREIEQELQPHHEAGTFPPLHLLRHYYQQIANDLEIVQRALIQRSAKRLQASVLLVTDKLAFMALAPFQHLLPDADHINPITYFSQHTHRHHVPYHPDFVLIGIKYDSLPADVAKRAFGEQRLDDLPPLPTFELMMIPHEAAHYMYHYGTVDGTTTIKTWSEAQFDHPWTEEIFADVYGCVVSGPLMALGLQALLAYSDKDAACANDGEHPTAIVRTFLVAEILRLLHELWDSQYPFIEVAQQLNENWATILRWQGHEVEGDVAGGACVIFPENGDRPIAVAEMLAHFRPMIATFVSFLLESAEPSFWNHTGSAIRPPHIPWIINAPDRLPAYDQVMADLTSTKVANKQMPQTLVDHKHISHNTLQQILQQWFDDGPLGIGGHGLNQTQENQLRALFTTNGQLTLSDVQGVVGRTFKGQQITNQEVTSLTKQIKKGR